jgi:hypothetical protein
MGFGCHITWSGVEGMVVGSLPQPRGSRWKDNRSIKEWALAMGHPYNTALAVLLEGIALQRYLKFLH